MTPERGGGGDGRADWWRLPDAGDWSDEDFYNIDTDRYDPRKLKLDCPCCGRTMAPLCSPSLKRHGGDWRWVGIDHKEPYTEWRARCPQVVGCGEEYRFVLHTPQ